MADLPIGATVRALRLHRGLSRMALAKAMGVFPIWISKTELGRTTPTLDSIFRLSEALGIEPWRLIRHACKMRDKQEAA